MTRHVVECIDIMSVRDWETTPKLKCHEQTEMLTLQCTFSSGDKLIKNKWKGQVQSCIGSFYCPMLCIMMS